MKKFFSIKENLKVIRELSNNLNIINEVLNENGRLKNLSFLITGRIENMSRAEIKSIIEKNSGRILSSVNKKLNYLVAGEKPTSKKIEQAKQMGIKIINHNELMKLLN